MALSEALTLLQQSFAEFRSGFRHERILLRSPLPHPRLVTIRTLGILRQLRQILSRFGLLQPTQCVHEADPLHFDPLPLRRLEHHHAHTKLYTIAKTVSSLSTPSTLLHFKMSIFIDVFK